MIRQIVFLGLLFIFCLEVIGQKIDTVETIEHCSQYKIIIEYIEKDKELLDYLDLRKIRFDFDPFISYNGTLVPMFSTELIAFDNNLLFDSVANMPEDSISELYKKYKNTSTDYYDLKSNCQYLESKKFSNTRLWFVRYNHRIVYALTRKVYKNKYRHSLGFLYMFGFDDDEEFVVYRIEYIE